MYHNIVYKEALEKVNSSDEDRIIDGLKALRESGKPESVSVVVGVLNQSESENVDKECFKFFNDIKDQKAANEIVYAIENTANTEKCKQALASAAWQNDLDYSEGLEVFVALVLNEDYLIAYEAFTVIENNIDKVEPQKANEFQNIISEGLANVSEEKKSMVEELLHVINDLKKG